MFRINLVSIGDPDTAVTQGWAKTHDPISRMMDLIAPQMGPVAGQRGERRRIGSEIRLWYVEGGRYLKMHEAWGRVAKGDVCTVMAVIHWPRVAGVKEGLAGSRAQPTVEEPAEMERREGSDDSPYPHMSDEPSQSEPSPDDLATLVDEVTGMVEDDKAEEDKAEEGVDDEDSEVDDCVLLNFLQGATAVKVEPEAEEPEEAAEPEEIEQEEAAEPEEVEQAEEGTGAASSSKHKDTHVRVRPGRKRRELNVGIVISVRCAPLFVAPLLVAPHFSLRPFSLRPTFRCAPFRCAPFRCAPFRCAPLSMRPTFDAPHFRCAPLSMSH